MNSPEDDDDDPVNNLGSMATAEKAIRMHIRRTENPNAKRPKLKQKEMDYLVECAWGCGAWCERGGNKHVKVYPSNGSRMITIPGTPSGSRTYDNKRKALHRAEITVP